MRFREKGDRAALDIFWYDGGMRPATPDELLADDRSLPTEGMLLVGDKGKILAGFECDSPRIIPESKFAEFRKARNIAAPAPLVDVDFSSAVVQGRGRAPLRPEQRGSGPGRSNDATPWVAAVKGGPKSFGDFLLAQPICEAFNLVAVSYRMGGQKLLWDAAAGRITNNEEANKYLTREYRQGWKPAGLID